MAKPLEVIANARGRIALVAAVRSAIIFAVPAVILVLLALLAGHIASAAWELTGYVLRANFAAVLRIGPAAISAAVIAAGAITAVKAYRRVDDTEVAAERIDAAIDGKQEVVSFVALSDQPAAGKPAERSSLFPVLLQHVASRLAGFDPGRTFRFDLAKPLRLASTLGAAALALFALIVITGLRPPTPEEVMAHKLASMAKEMASNENPALSAAIREAASAMANPKLPAKEKLKRLAQAEHAIERATPPPVRQAENTQRRDAGGRGSGGKSDSGKGTGEGKGKGTGKGTGQGNGSGTGNGPNNSGNRAPSSAELKNEISKAQTLIEADNSNNGPPQPKPSAQSKAGHAPKPGTSPNPNGPGKSQENQKMANSKLPKPASSGTQQPKPGSGPGQQQSDKGPGKGDTHLGMTPKPTRFERFYKKGRHGFMLNIKDARYVILRLPPAALPAGGRGNGEMVLDTKKAVATTPYTNQPLKDQRLGAETEERQLVPPRYRALIR